MENRINAYVPDLNVSFEELQQQLTAFIQTEREQLKTCVLKGEGNACRTTKKVKLTSPLQSNINICTSLLHILTPSTLPHHTLHSLHNVRKGLGKSIHVLPVEVSGGFVQCQQTTVETKGLSKSQTNDDGSQHLVMERGKRRRERRKRGRGKRGRRRRCSDYFKQKDVSVACSHVGHHTFCPALHLPLMSSAVSPLIMTTCDKNTRLLSIQLILQ